MKDLIVSRVREILSMKRDAKIGLLTILDILVIMEINCEADLPNSPVDDIPKGITTHLCFFSKFLYDSFFFRSAKFAAPSSFISFL
jgi:hypothetical protein